MFYFQRIKLGSSPYNPFQRLHYIQQDIMTTRIFTENTMPSATISIHERLYTNRQTDRLTCVYKWKDLQVYTNGKTYMCIQKDRLTDVYKWTDLHMCTTGQTYMCMHTNLHVHGDRFTCSYRHYLTVYTHHHYSNVYTCHHHL